MRILDFYKITASQRAAKVAGTSNIILPEYSCVKKIIKFTYDAAVTGGVVTNIYGDGLKTGNQILGVTLLSQSNAAGATLAAVVGGTAVFAIANNYLTFKSASNIVAGTYIIFEVIESSDAQ